MPTKTKKPTPTPTQAAAPKPAPGIPEVKLTEFQKELCELFGDMILNRADEDDLHFMLNALMRHQYRRKFGFGSKYAAAAPEFGDKHANGWVTRVVKAWPEKMKTIVAEPTTISEYVRRSLNMYLEDDFEEFIADAAPEERHFLHEVMTTWRSNSNGDGVCFVNAFETELRRDRRYVFVPEHDLIDEVKRFVDVLMDGPQKAA